MKNRDINKYITKSYILTCAFVSVYIMQICTFATGQNFQTNPQSQSIKISKEYFTVILAVQKPISIQHQRKTSPENIFQNASPAYPPTPHMRSRDLRLPHNVHFAPNSPVPPTLALIPLLCSIVLLRDRPQPQD